MIPQHKLHLVECIGLLHPDFQPERDYILQDDSDGRGPYIKEWKHNFPAPSDEELRGAWTQLQSKPRMIPLTPEEEIKSLKAQVAELRQMAGGGS